MPFQQSQKALSTPQPVLVVAGHICLDIIPGMAAAPKDFYGHLSPGRLVEVESALISTGGAVSNTGIALHRLGMEVRLLGKTGQDIFGETILRLLNQIHPSLTRYMLQDPQTPTSYSLVISPPDQDRMFFHHPGTNHTFCCRDISSDALSGAGFFHLGYPPVMKRLLENNGEELVRIFFRAREAGLHTSLDMCMPDPGSSSGQANWPAILERILPHVDLFTPSLGEIVYFLRSMIPDKPPAPSISTPMLFDLLDRVSKILLDMGSEAVLIKCGIRGLYFRSSNIEKQLEAAGFRSTSSETWTGRELMAPGFVVQVSGTTGAGDCAIAGFLAGWARGKDPLTALLAGAAAGAASVESRDATSAIPSMAALEKRIHEGWEQHHFSLKNTSWKRDPATGILMSPADKSSL